MEWFQAALHWNVTNVIPSSGTWHFCRVSERACWGLQSASRRTPTHGACAKQTHFSKIYISGYNWSCHSSQKEVPGIPSHISLHRGPPSSAGVVWVLWVPYCCSQLLSTACCQPQCTLQQGLGLVPHAAPCRATAAYPSMWCHGLVMSLGSCKDHIQDLKEQGLAAQVTCCRHVSLVRNDGQGPRIRCMGMLHVHRASLKLFSCAWCHMKLSLSVDCIVVLVGEFFQRLCSQTATLGLWQPGCHVVLCHAGHATNCAKLIKMQIVMQTVKVRRCCCIPLVEVDIW